MSNFLSFLTLGVGIYFALFLFWKLLRDDYEDSDIFSLWFVSLVGGILGFSLANLFLSEDALFLGTASAVIFGALRAKKLKMKMVEILESSVPSVFLFFLFVLASWAIRGVNLSLAIDFALALFGLVLFWFFKLHYRRFLWYPSGKPGFASLASVSVYFILRAVVAFFASRMLSLDLVLFSLPATLTFGLFVGITSLVLLYIQSERADFGRFLRNNK